MAEGCLLNYTARMNQDRAQTQRVLYYLVELEGIEQPLIFSGPYHSSGDNNDIGFGHKPERKYAWKGFATSVHDPELKLGKKFKRKDLKKITLVLAGDIAGYGAQRLDLFGEGRKITKVVYEKN